MERLGYIAEYFRPMNKIVFNNPDGNFPNGVPNPMLEENRKSTIEAIKKENAHLGVAWDGDYDRCFFFDEQGNFIEGYYIVGLLAKSILKKHPGEKIVHDPRLVWNTNDIVKKASGESVVSKSGHAYIKQKMRELGLKKIPKGPRRTTRKNPAGLTIRQMEVLKLLGKGLSNIEISNQLYISSKTVDHHVSAILSKLNIHSRFEAADFVHNKGLYNGR